MAPGRGRGRSRNDGDNRKSTTHQNHPSYDDDMPTMTRMRPVHKWKRWQEGTGRTTTTKRWVKPACPHTIPPCMLIRIQTCMLARVHAGSPPHHPSLLVRPQTRRPNLHTHPHRWPPQPCPPPSPVSMVATATSPVLTTMAATPSPNVDDYGGYPQPQRLQLQWPSSASVATALSPMPTCSVSFFSLFFILCTPSSSVVTVPITPPPFCPADHEHHHIVMVTSPKTVAGVALWHTYLAFSGWCDFVHRSWNA